ncbi:hypothetical protein AAFF_G00190870 [Aldrovandia affinis]|uniref:Uncharacterized protein n=1 Tax=Aldrovandia affinis TaxID=143900 RepID=A0AAD7RJ60_9TELE|nr:hypothetical protein AAFF_G00190870 [Aldrovandia affinis]
MKKTLAECQAEICRSREKWRNLLDILQPKITSNRQCRDSVLPPLSRRSVGTLVLHPQQLKTLLPAPQTLGHECTRGQGVRSPWRRHELSPVRTPQSSGQKGQVVTRKNKAVSQLERPLTLLPASSASRIHAEASCSSPVISPRNQNTGQTVEASAQPRKSLLAPSRFTVEQGRVFRVWSRHMSALWFRVWPRAVKSPAVGGIPSDPAALQNRSERVVRLQTAVMKDRARAR